MKWICRAYTLRHSFVLSGDCVRKGIRRKTLPNLLLKTSAVATPDKSEQPKEEEEDLKRKVASVYAVT